MSGTGSLFSSITLPVRTPSTTMLKSMLSRSWPAIVMWRVSWLPKRCPRRAEMRYGPGGKLVTHWSNGITSYSPFAAALWSPALFRKGEGLSDFKISPTRSTSIGSVNGF